MHGLWSSIHTMWVNVCGMMCRTKLVLKHVVLNSYVHAYARTGECLPVDIDRPSCQKGASMFIDSSRPHHPCHTHFNPAMSCVAVCRTVHGYILCLCVDVAIGYVMVGVASVVAIVGGMGGGVVDLVLGSMVRD